MSKHTPGPWRTLPCPHGGLIVVRGAAGGHMQSHVQIVPEADARLFAAAPELLEACKDVLNFLNVNREPMMVNRLRALIAKAGGVVNSASIEGTAE